MPDLSPKMITSLRNLAAAGGRVSAYGVDMYSAGVHTHSVEALVRRGLVERNTPEGSDYYDYVITEAGQQALTELDGA